MHHPTTVARPANQSLARVLAHAIDAGGKPRHRIASECGMHRETLRGWVRQAEIDGGVRPGTTTSDAERLAELERENRELRRTNHILRTASAFFAAELDRPTSR